MIGRIYPEATTPQSRDEVHKLMMAVKEQYPEVYRSLKPTENQVQSWLDANGIQLREGATTADVPMMSLRHPVISEAINLFATKLFCALYYFHTGRILTREGGILFRWHSNAQSGNQQPPVDILAPLLNEFGELRRQNTSLHDQFFYQYGLANDRPAAAFYAFLHQSLSFLGFVFPELATVRVPDNTTVLRPLPG